MEPNSPPGPQKQTSDSPPITNWAPRPKVATGGAVGTPLAIVLVWIAGQVGLELNIEVALAMAGLLIVIVGYITPEE